MSKKIRKRNKPKTKSLEVSEDLENLGTFLDDIKRLPPELQVLHKGIMQELIIRIKKGMKEKQKGE